MIKNVFLTGIFLLTVFCMHAQQEVTWQDLSDVSFESKYFKSSDDYFLVPDFGKSVKELEGEEISITGYFLSLSPEDGVYMLSQNPMASCFFCGGGGPESVLEIKFKEKPSFKTDEVVTITGKLKLNADDINHCNYILTGASGFAL
ncbi:hypothetical protein [Sinomicrobium weinanense]|uniref:DUF3299 domain-containing protein n=1 Tax=Sinomicrobium weinanense TaxID=2842200 RepID=A0A926JWV7_9FLAO|nr:hypothetical protein [Sinomicrobium weinanense]MBC9798636.1 hypothetical protein [Sinomicrobium weinanense]MBU3122800.1 hypothetical protein [Sinomicrobium weinanense]